MTRRHWRELNRRFHHGGHRRFDPGERERPGIQGVDETVNFLPNAVHDLFPEFPVPIFIVLVRDAMVGSGSNVRRASGSSWDFEQRKRGLSRRWRIARQSGAKRSVTL